MVEQCSDNEGSNFLLLIRIGATDDLLAITEIYPKKTSLFWFSVLGMIYCGIKRRTKNLFQRLFHPTWEQ